MNQPRVALMGRRQCSITGVPQQVMHYRDLQVSRGWPALVQALRWDLLRMTQSEFGRLFAVNAMRVSRWERGESPLPEDVLERMFEIMGELNREEGSVERNGRANRWGYLAEQWKRNREEVQAAMARKYGE